MAGLKEEIASEVRLFKPTNLQMAIELAKRKDEQIQGGRKFGDSSRAYNKPPVTTTDGGMLRENQNSANGETRKLTWEEMHAKNLCFEYKAIKEIESQYK